MRLILQFTLTAVSFIAMTIVLKLSFIIARNLCEIPSTAFHNEMKSNTDKYYLIEIANESTYVQVGDTLTENSDCQKLFGIKTEFNIFLTIIPIIFVLR